jgi:DNA-binding FrmR family transcriptional regulator
MSVHDHKHHHHHDEEHIKAISNRLSKAIGHLESVKKMVEDDRDCSEVLIQLAAVRSAINNCGKEILKEHISHCIVHAVQDGDAEAVAELNEAIDKFMKNP